MSIPRLKHYQRTSADMKNLTSKVVYNAAHLLASHGCDFTEPSISAIVNSFGEEQLVYGIHLDSTHGAQARQSRFYGIRKLFATEPTQIPDFSYRGTALLPCAVNTILSYVYMRAEAAPDGGRSTLKVFFGKASRPNAGKVEEFFSLAKAPATRGMELLGTGAKTDIVPAGSGGTPIAIAEKHFSTAAKDIEEDAIKAALAATSGSSAIADRLDTDFRSVFASDAE